MSTRRPSRTATSAVPAHSQPTLLAADLTLSFADLGVPATLCRALVASGIDHPFPVQSATLPATLAGRDVLGRGRTGSGKTLAFALPLVTRLAGTKSESKRPRGLVLAPTRELAAQIEQVIKPLAAVGKMTVTTVFGGVSPAKQIAALRAGVDIVVACPGRLEDLISSGHVSLADVQVTVLDEADHMADLGFLPAVRRLLDQTPAGGQRMLFSATLDAGVGQLVRRYLVDPVERGVDTPTTPVAPADHQILQITIEQRLEVLVGLVSGTDRCIVFTRTKHRAKTLARQLVHAGCATVELHGNLAQPRRVANLAAFSTGKATVLVATDIAARGIHVDDVTLVIHADPPIEHKAYLHRSGRTARAGAAGQVITLMTSEQAPALAKLVKAAGLRPQITQHVSAAGQPATPTRVTPSRNVPAVAGAGWERPAG